MIVAAQFYCARDPNNPLNVGQVSIPALLFIVQYNLEGLSSSTKILISRVPKYPVSSPIPPLDYEHGAS